MKLFTRALILSIMLILLVFSFELGVRHGMDNTMVATNEDAAGGLDEKEGLGGAEEELEQVDSDYVGYLFPVHPDDFLFYTSAYGWRVSPILGTERKHNGVDIATVWLAQVVAIADGTVIEHWPPPDGYYKGHRVYGGMIKIEHDDGSQSLYAHLSHSRVRTGQRVKAGNIIGRIGNTGMSRGYHLHLELFIAGENVNPLLYLQNPEEAIDQRSYGG